MEKALAIAAVLGPIYLVLGLSCVIYAEGWQKVLHKWEKDHYSLLPIALMQMVLGILVVRMYNVWEWHLWLIVTISGWAMLVKGVLYLLIPGKLLKSCLKMGRNKAHIYLSGVASIVLGAVLSYYVYFV